MSSDQHIKALEDVRIKKGLRDGAQKELERSIREAQAVLANGWGMDLLKGLELAELQLACNVTDGALETEYAGMRVVKSTDEQRYTLGLAYPAMRMDASVAADGYQDFVSPEVLEKTAWTWMQKHRAINLFHQDGTDGHAEVVESYIYRGPDWDAGNTVIKSGDWMLGTVWDEYGWDLVKAGIVKGWSPEGGARRTLPNAERLAQLRN